MGLGIVFSGQGNQYPEMLQKLNQHNPKVVAELAERLGFKLIPEINLSREQLFANEYAQPLIAGYEYLIWQELAQHIPSPQVMSGYSLGEVTAFAVSAGLGLDDLLAVVRKRSALMDNTQVKSGLAAITGLNKDALLSICGQFECYLAIQNGPDQFVVGGERNNLTACIENISRLPQQIKVIRLDVAVASHTPLLASASKEFADYLADYAKVNLTTKLIAGISGNIHYSGATFIPELARQIQTTIYFNRVAELMAEAGAEVILEIGPGKALAGIIKKCLPHVIVKSVDDFSSISGLITWLNSKLT